MKQAPHLRTRRRRTRKKNLVVFLLIAIGLLISLFLEFDWLQTSKNPDNKQNDVVQTAQVSHSETTKELPSETDQKTIEVEWVIQDQPVKLPILMYHGVHVMSPSEASNANNIIDPALFDSQLKALKEAGYYSLTPEEAYKVLTENVLPNNQKVVWLTFDDSIVDFYTDAYPILNKYQMKATNNVITGFVQSEIPGSLTLAQIQEMKAGGMSFQSHTVNHPSLDNSTTDTQTHELSQAKAYLDQVLNQETLAIAYPSGRYTETTLSIAQSLDYKLGVTTNNGLASLTNGLLSLNRIRILPISTPEHLLAEIAY